MRQCKIIYRRGSAEWSQIDPQVHGKLLDRPVVQASLEFLRNTPADAVVCHDGDEFYNLVCFTREEKCPQSIII